jgi:hypothetical protein
MMLTAMRQNAGALGGDRRMQPMCKRHPRTFGRGRGYVSPRARRARYQARAATAALLLVGLLLSVGSYALMGMAAHDTGHRYADLAGIAMLSGMVALCCFIVAAAAAGEC